MKTVELFAGIGGFRLAAEENGLTTVWANDIDHTAATVYKDNFGEYSLIEGDIKDYLDAIPDHDLLTGGFPCQPFSKAGKKQGIADYRGTLFEIIVNVLKSKNPTFFILENVNSLLYMDNGKHYRTILSALSGLDYKIEWRVFNAASFGLAQHRERVIIVGAKNIPCSDSYFIDDNDLSIMKDCTIDKIARYYMWDDIEKSRGKFKEWGMAYKGKFVTESVKDQNYFPPKKLYEILEENPGSAYDFTTDTIERIKNSQFVNRYYNGVQILYNQSGGARMGYSIFGIDGLSPTLTASTSRHYERYKIGESYRRLTNIEYARLQGFPDHHCDATSPYNQYKLYGNAVPHQIISYVMKKVINISTRTINKKSFNLFDTMEDE